MFKKKNPTSLTLLSPSMTPSVAPWPSQTETLTPTPTLQPFTETSFPTPLPTATPSPTNPASIPTEPAKASATQKPDQINLAIPVCAGNGQIKQLSQNFGITGTIVYQTDLFGGLYTIGGSPLAQGKIIDGQQQIMVYGFSHNGEWLSYAPEVDWTTSEQVEFSTPKMILLSAGGKRIEQDINTAGLEEELQNRCVGCQGFHFFDSNGEWINNSLMYMNLGARANIQGSAFSSLPKVLNPFTDHWQNQWFNNLPDLYTISPTRATYHNLKLSPDLSRILYPANHGGIILRDLVQGKDIWSDSDFRNDGGENIEWSPDSKMVAVVNLFYPHEHRLLLITRDGDVTDLVNAESPQPDTFAGSLSWSSDSRYLAFKTMLNNSNDVNLYLYDSQTKSYVYRCPLPGVLSVQEANLVWSPDNKWIAFREDPIGSMRLLNVQSGEVIELLKNAEPAGWSNQFPISWP